KWYAQGVPGLPPKKRVPLASDKNVARQMLAELVRKAERGEAGLEDAATEAQRTPLAEHLLDFEVALKARPVSAKHVRVTVARVKDVFNGCGFAYPRDLDAVRLEEYLASRRQLPSFDDVTLFGGETSNYCVGPDIVYRVGREIIEKPDVPRS